MEEKGRFSKFMKDLEKEYNGIAVLEDLGCFGKKGDRYAIFLCPFCGTSFKSRVAPIKSKSVVSCGCYGKAQRLKASTTHGMSGKGVKDPLYDTWSNMKSRCYNKNNPMYKYYGEKGVTICEEWLKDFASFRQWALDNGWKKGMNVDKDIKGSLQYGPDTCLIVSHIVNSQIESKPTFKSKTKTGYPFVSVDERKSNKKFFGQRTVLGKRVTTKYFVTPEEAYEALKEKLQSEGISI